MLFYLFENPIVLYFRCSIIVVITYNCSEMAGEVCFTLSSGRSSNFGP